jgi:WD40 repeat protein
LAFSPDGKKLASGSFDKTIKLWDLDSRQEYATLAGHNDGIVAVAFSPDGKILASASLTIKLWDPNTCKELATLCDIANYGTNFDLNGVTLFRVYG